MKDLCLNAFWLCGCEQAAVEEKACLAKEKELETARLRAKQERAADRQAEIDELRARRFLTFSLFLCAVLYCAGVRAAVQCCGVLCCPIPLL